MARNCPLVSIIVPTYNRENSVVRSIDSAVTQTYDDVEIIVVDDGSTDDTVKNINSTFGEDVTLIEHESNKGGSAARNTGIDEASGDYIAFLDSDDVWLPGKIEHDVKLLDNRSDEYIGVISGIRYTSQNRVVSMISNLAVQNFAVTDRCTLEGVLSLKENIGGASTFFVRRGTVEEVGGFDERFERHQDFEFLARCLKEGKLLRVGKVFVEKHESGYPDAKSVTKSKALLFNKFQEEISQFQNNGVPVKKYHNFDLARCHFRNGSLSSGVMLLSKSKPAQPVHVLSLIKAFIDRVKQSRRS